MTNKLESTPRKNENCANFSNKNADPISQYDLCSHSRRKSSFRSRVNQFKRNFRQQHNHVSGFTGLANPGIKNLRFKSPVPIAQKFFEDFDNSESDNKRKQYLARKQKLESLISEREIDEIRQRIWETIKC